MKIAIISIYFIHHWEPFCEELYKLLKDDFCFIATSKMTNSLKNNGYPQYIDRKYLINAFESDDNLKKSKKIAYEADVVILGNAPFCYKIIRSKVNKITFEQAERWFKRGYINLLSPRLIKSQLFYYLFLRNKRYYMLNSSAYAYSDLLFMHSFKDKCFKWGYFTKVMNIDIYDLMNKKRNRKVVKFIWCARFLKWKHPELPIFLAAELKEIGISNIEFNMYGSGPYFDSSLNLIKKLYVSDVVKLHGNVPNSEIVRRMRDSDIFLFTSDRREGWGAVLNEAMSNGCVAISSDSIGATPYLIEHNKNGLIFESNNLKSLLEQTKYLLNNPLEREKMSVSAYETMREVWSPENVAKQFLELVSYLLGESNYIPIYGPCSKSEMK